MSTEELSSGPGWVVQIVRIMVCYGHVGLLSICWAWYVNHPGVSLHYELIYEPLRRWIEILIINHNASVVTRS